MSRNILHYFGSSATKTGNTKSADTGALDGEEALPGQDLKEAKNAGPSKDKCKLKVKPKVVKTVDETEGNMEQSEDLELFSKGSASAAGIQHYFKKLGRQNVDVKDLEPSSGSEVAEDGLTRLEVKKTYKNKRKRPTRENSKSREVEVVCLSTNCDTVSIKDMDETSPEEDRIKERCFPNGSERSTSQRRNWNLRIKYNENAADENIVTIATSEDEKDVKAEDSGPRRSSRIRRNRVEVSDDNTREEAEPIKVTGRRQKRESSDEDVEILDSSKVAPIFLKRGKTKELRVVKKATLEFLHSGIPEALKQQIEIQAAVDSREVEIFPRVSHVVQLDESPLWKLRFPENLMKLLRNSRFPDSSREFKKPQFNLGLCVKEPVVNLKNEEPGNLGLPLTWRSCKQIVQSVKLQEDYPYFRTLRTLLKRKNSWLNSGQADMVWTDVYQPKSSAELLGDRRTILQLKQWLHRWKPVSKTSSSRDKKKKKSVKKNKRARIDSSSDVESDFDISEEFAPVASEDDDNQVCNSVLLTGPTGGGKTALVYALACELGFTVLEINASSRRSSKLVLSQLQEATQSHSLGNAAVTNKFFGTNSKESGHTGLALILFEDVDLILEAEDESFHSAVSTILASSKRPIIMTATTPISDVDHTVPVLQEKIRGRFEVFIWSRPSLSSACSYLWSLCLVEGCYLSLSSLKSFLQQESSADTIDLRSAILQLQLLLSKHPYQRKLAFNQIDVKDSNNHESGPVGEVAVAGNGISSHSTGTEVQPIELPRRILHTRPSVFRTANRKPRYVHSAKENTVEIASGQAKRFSRICFLDDSLYEADSNDATEVVTSMVEDSPGKTETVAVAAVPSTSIAVLERTSRLLDNIASSDVLAAACSSLNPDFKPSTNRVSGVEDSLPDFAVPLSWNGAETQREIQETLCSDAWRLLEKDELCCFNDSSCERPSDTAELLPLSTLLRNAVRSTDYEPAVRFHCRVALERWIDKQKKKRSSRQVNSSKVLVHPFDLLVNLDSLVSMGNQF